MCTFDALHQAAIDAKETCHSSRGTFQKKLEAFLDWVEPYVPVGDVLIQQQPNITAIVWGGLRFLIRVRRSLGVSVDPFSFMSFAIDKRYSC
jgi:hypothetical protein